MNGVEYINSKKFKEITGISNHLIHALTKENIIPHKRNPKNNRLLFLEADAYLFRDHLDDYIINPGFKTFEKYDHLKLKQHLFKYSGLYDYKNGIFITNKDENKESNQ
ncbi:hypothetical protein [Solidesulfovibrio carbinolicus]|uniref:hypothetical protein n=1 Tax=Solidesulfovibrio carbinolicus TaxID=296842 RepID=UPI0010139D6D|nr:hypothetical protein [Solidesulfovibrio carbinolicus]